MSSPPVKWLRANKVPQLFNELIKQLVKDKPGEPYSYLLEILTKKNGGPLPGQGSNLSEDEAATKIQALKRGKDARSEVAAKRAEKTAGTTTAKSPSPVPQAKKQEKASNLDEDAAATKLQAVQRGRMAREEVKSMKGIRVSPHILSDGYISWKLPLVPLSKHIVDAGYISFSEMEENAAATKLQSVQRGRSDRKRVEELKANKGASGGASESASPAEEPAAATAEEDAAATKLQAVQRGRMDREKVKSMRGPKVANHVLDFGYIDFIGPLIPLATHIVKCGYVSFERPLIPLATHIVKCGYVSFEQLEQEKAAVKLQSFQRGHAARQEVQQMKAAR